MPLSVPRIFWPLVILVLLSSVPLDAAEDAFEFAEATIEDLQSRMASGGLTSERLTAAYLERIEKIDRAGPQLNAVIEINPDALAIAAELDAERQAGTVRGPLHGIPILLKDNIATADKMQTTAGSLALVGSKPPRDAFVVTRLRAAGAVILGKTNLSEWANFRGERSVSGWSARGGQTRNPYVLDRSPLGSSAGSAVAVAANLCVAAIGTETTGSIVAPASVCDVVGLKPTVGFVSRAGVIPVAASFDTAGPITRTVRDAALVLAALAGVDARDAATTALPAELATQISAPPPGGALKGTRIGWLRAPGSRPYMDRATMTALQVIRAAGAQVIDLGEMPRLAELNPARLEVMLYEMKAGINAYLAELGPDSPMKTLADVIAFNDDRWSVEQPLFGQQYFMRAQAKGPLTERAYLEAREKSWRLTRTEGIDALMTRHRLDAIVSVTTGAPPLIVRSPVPDPVFGPAGPGGGGGALAPAVAGYPSITVPMAEAAGLPFGLLFFGRAWSEPKLIALATDFEARTKARELPRFVPTADVPSRSER
jgi:amidase